MAKNTGSTQFRRINVDDYDDEKYMDDESMGDGHGDVEGPNEGEISSLLTQGRNVDALRTVLANPPLTTKNQVVKDKAFQLVLKVILSFKTAEIDEGLKSLDATSLDILMKYIYRGFEIPSEGSSAQLLTWHEKAFSIGGLGSIVRVLTDRKRV